MISSSHAAVRRLAGAFRDAIERLPAAYRPVALADFPLGSCGHVSDLLGSYLTDHGLGHFEYIAGERATGGVPGIVNHVWLEQNGLIVDITADQFDEIGSSVIVEVDSPWHGSWTRRAHRRANFRAGGMARRTALAAAYTRIVALAARDR